MKEGRKEGKRRTEDSPVVLDVGERDGNRRGNDLSEWNEEGVDSRVKKRTGSVSARSNSKWGKQ